MKLETLEEVRKKKKEIERKIGEKTGEKEGPITRRIASAGLSDELKEEAGLHSKLQSAERQIEEAQEITESINTEKHEKLLKKYRDKGEYTRENEYHDEEVEKANKISKGLEHFLKAIKGDEEEIFLNKTEEPEKDSLNRKEITKELLQASRKLSRARSILKTQDKPGISEQQYKELKDLAEDTEKERKELLETAEKAENYLRAAQKNIEELESISQD
jgi:hypothetical protein